MAIVINGNGIDMGGNPVSNASQVDSTVINENGDNVATTSNLVGFKNYIINGGFDIWQRGTSYDPSTARYGAADRWWSYANSAGVLISQQTINTNGKYDLKIETNSSSIVDIRQGIECVTGKQLSKATQYTLSFVASFPVGSNVLVSIGYADNMSFVDGKFLAQDQIIGTGTGGYETYTVTVNNAVPNSTNTMLIVAIGGGSFSSSHYISNVQLEEGSVATPFENRPYGLELSLCQRYYEIGHPTHWATHIIDNPAQMYAFNPIIRYTVVKRVVPTLILNEVNGTLGIQIVGQNNAGFDFRNINTNITGTNDKYFTFTADAEL